ncbi:MAG TPA: Gfo/Idh/MocA family oxidoreductase [Tepidisphaeraceae bacterium]|nr:Gfo/Idh/MocA family oxidoreductase [Tepidisphaeraceae bacterium]
MQRQLEPVRVGVIGCGAISGAYLGMAKNFPIVQVAACADLDLDRAGAQAEQFSVPKVSSVDDLLRDDAIELVLNLTIPKAHAAVAMRAVEAGKHTYAEKPLGINREEGRRLLEAAQKRGVKIGCAPDTFMGAGLQTARKLIDDGAIGKPVAFTAFMMGRGHEHWHPSPEFYYEVGGGPMFDMGPYYLTALLNLFGPVKRIMGMTSIALPQRTITSEPKRGKTITVETPDHVVGTMEFENGAVGTIIQSFAMPHAPDQDKQPIRVYGTTGTMRVPDPNQFDGPVHVRGRDELEWREIPHEFPTGYGRSVGVADMAYAIRSGRPLRASGEQAFAVLDLMAGFLESSERGGAISPSISYARSAPMPQGLPFGVLDF